MPRPWTIVCKDVDQVFELEYSTYHVLNRSELCECSLTEGNYLLSQTASNCGDMPEAKDGYFTKYYAFNKIELDVLMEKFHIQVDDNTITQSALLHNNIPGYDLPALNFVSPSKEPNENRIFEEENPQIYTHLENILMHMINEQDAQLFKSRNDYNRNQRKFTQYLKHAELWQSTSILCSYAACLCDILLIVTFIAFSFNTARQCKPCSWHSLALTHLAYLQLKLIQLVEPFPLSLPSTCQRRNK